MVYNSNLWSEILVLFKPKTNIEMKYLQIHVCVIKKKKQVYDIFIATYDSVFNMFQVVNESFEIIESLIQVCTKE